MRQWMFMVAGAGLLAAAQFTQAETVQQGADGRGRYEGVAASEAAVWVIDTHTGKVRKCTQEFADQTPACTQMSN